MSQSIRLSLYRHRVECVVFVEWKPYSACVGKRDDSSNLEPISLTVRGCASPHVSCDVDAGCWLLVLSRVVSQFNPELS
jgi:hypothetical protein